MLENEVRTECLVQDAVTAEGGVTPGTCAMLGERPVDETPQTQANRRLFHPSRGELGFVSREGTAENKLPSMEYCTTQIHSAEQPLDFNCSSFNIPTLIALYVAQWGGFFLHLRFMVHSTPQKQTPTSLTVKKTNSYYLAREV